MQTRTIATVLGVLGIVLSCAGKPTKGAIGAKGSPDGANSVPSASSYVQDGLIALWDGIENVDWGQHDSAATVWKDLVGGRTATLTSHGAFSDNGLVCDGVGYAADDGACLARADVRCVEIVFEKGKAGIICGLANSEAQSALGGIRIICEDSNITVGIVNSSSIGLNNRVRYTMEGTHSVSVGYDTNAVVRASVDGQPKGLYYQASAVAMSTICFGGRAQYTDIPFGGKILCVRVYRRELTAEEVLKNYTIDKARFGL